MKQYFHVMVLVIACVCTSSAQVIKGLYPFSAEPSIGWDSLRTRINFPYLESVSRFNGMATVSVDLDSMGRVTNMAVKATSDQVESSIRTALRGILWKPPRDSEGQPISGFILFQVSFNLLGTPGVTTLSVEAEPTQPHADSLQSWMRRLKLSTPKQ